MFLSELYKGKNVSINTLSFFEGKKHTYNGIVKEVYTGAILLDTGTLIFTQYIESIELLEK